jgi:hypothetical protein
VASRTRKGRTGPRGRRPFSRARARNLKMSQGWSSDGAGRGSNDVRAMARQPSSDRT